MEKIKAKFIIFATKTLFTNYLNGATSATDGYFGYIPAYSVVFIRDTNELWSNGLFQTGAYNSKDSDGIVPAPKNVDGLKATANLAWFTSGTGVVGWTLLYFGGIQITSRTEDFSKTLTPTFKNITLTDTSIGLKYFLATPTSTTGAPSFRLLTASDISSGTIALARLQSLSSPTSSSAGNSGYVSGASKSFYEKRTSTFLGADALWHTLGTMAFENVDDYLKKANIVTTEYSYTLAHTSYSIGTDWTTDTVIDYTNLVPGIYGITINYDSVLYSGIFSWNSTTNITEEIPLHACGVLTKLDSDLKGRVYARTAPTSDSDTTTIIQYALEKTHDGITQFDVNFKLIAKI